MKTTLTWLQPQGCQTGAASFGIPWEKGVLDRSVPLYLYDEQGDIVPAQHEARAYWPDGSVKWTLHSAALTSPSASYTVSDEAPAAPAQGPVLRMETLADGLRITNGSSVWTLRNGRTPLLCRYGAMEIEGRLIMLCDQRLETGSDDQLTRTVPYDGEVRRIVVERQGDCCCVVKLNGVHVRRSRELSRIWLPFELRLYFFAGEASVRMVHTFVYDGNQEEDFIRGVGMTFTVPMSGELHNRFVRLGGETGLFCESPLSLWDRRKQNDPYRRQLAGKINPAPSHLCDSDMTIWRDYKLTQLSSDHYDIRKRTGDSRVYVRGGAGRRAMGVAYAGSVGGGLALFRRDFWQKAPSSLEINHTTSSTAEMKLWFYSPDGEPMDLRHYDLNAHPNHCYEGFNEMFSTPNGVANTNEMVFEPFSTYPGNDALVERARCWQSPNLLLCDPAYLLRTRALGDSFAPEDRSTPGKALIESYLDDLFEQHKRIREQYDMYGFWDYGDIRHAYDPDRHNWMYDMGGFAWQNTELVPNLWLWFGFLRSNREDYFRWAEAMTRHCSEVDLYHSGPFRGLGSRHNVVHWGCSCKECRMTLTQLYKPYYYLTGDERTGAIMTRMKDVDMAMVAMDKLRYNTLDDLSCHPRLGPDLMVMLGNWLTHWERTEDSRYRDKILKTVEHLRGADGFCHVKVWGVDPQTSEMTLASQDPPGGPNWHFNYCFGSEYVWPEILNVLEDEELWHGFLNSGLIFSLDGDPDGLADRFADAPTPPKGNMKSYWNGVAAYAAGKTGDRTLAMQCWENIIGNPGRPQHDNIPMPIRPRRITGSSLHREVDEYPFITGNNTGQWGSHVIVMLAHIARYVDEYFESIKP
ncbi:MAG: hypothetical protein IJ507_07180 [Clostridia bacterium]|nr:hypothetical protein [Clostridia bacterium]